MHLYRITMVALVALSGALGCAKETPTAISPYNPIAGVSYVPAGTLFRVTLIDPVSSDTAVPGQVFAARLRDPLLAPDGRVLAPVGAPVFGRVVAVQRGEHARLALSFDSVETFEGIVNLDTRLFSTLDGPFEVGNLRTSREGEADVVLRPSTRAIGGGPQAEGARSPAVSIEGNTDLELVLTTTMIVERTGQ